MKVMTLDKLETHDRLLEYNKQAYYIAQGCYDCIKSRPAQFESYPFYIFSHMRTDDDGYTKRLIWSPRLTKPKPQTNSMLFRVCPPDLDKIEIVWMLPARELWGQFKPDTMTHDPIIYQSILKFRHNREFLAKTEEGDVSEDIARNVYRAISRCKKKPQILSE